MEGMMGLIFLGFCIVSAAVIVMAVRVYQVRPDFVKKVLKYMVIGFFVTFFSIVSAVVGIRINSRHEGSYSKNLRSVQQIWGGRVNQSSPRFFITKQEPEEYEQEKTGRILTRMKTVIRDTGFQGQHVLLDIKSNIREKGLLKFPGYNAVLKGTYTVKNNETVPGRFTFAFPLPDNSGNITDIAVTMNGKVFTEDTNFADGIHWTGILRPGEMKEFGITYKAQGVERYQYSFKAHNVEIKTLDVLLNTDFSDITIPDGAMVPSTRAQDTAVSRLQWKHENLVTGQNIAVEFNIPGNYGALAAKLFFYSPIAFILFIGLVLLFTISRNVSLHPMQYLFLLTGFFIFYLLGSYLMSYLHIIAAIFVSLFVSSGIMLYYVYLLKKDSVLIKAVALSAVIFQWLFSMAFFLPEHTGFIITVASIAAFIVLMKSTAEIDWENKW
ncbi:MAG TPA: hypothetical protein PK544_02780 [Spirochaetota bacterium]|nr:hypothetical protein [Spirochaetota bacterium]HPJ38879.1 hypothetical protein [Spirochaetota bacterium]HPQ54223.1 hypothetical protein [Spirochaetota bacterium]